MRKSLEKTIVSLKSFIAAAMLMTACITGLSGGCFAQPASGDGAPIGLHGKRLFLRCASCHDISDSGVSRIGPNLKGVVGRKAGSFPGYSYSPAMKATDFVWTEAILDRWLTDPNTVVPGTSMAFGGLPKPEDRAAIIAYLANPAP
jgi:cytochrome c